MASIIILRFWVFHYYFTRFHECWISSINWSPFPPSVSKLDSMSTVLSDAFRLALALGVPGSQGREAKGTYWMRLMRAAQLHNIIYIYNLFHSLTCRVWLLLFHCGLVATPSPKIRRGHIRLWWLIFFLDLFVHLSVLPVSNGIYNLYYLWHTSIQCICTNILGKDEKSIAWADMFSLNSLSGKGAGI